MKSLGIILITIVVVLTIMFGVNYFTLFGYYLPHKPQVVYMSYQDISAHFYPQFVAVSSNSSVNFTWGLKLASPEE
ncbi:MAG: hypothetical protein KKD44_28470 [Proteobacteria bacterium]|nr:hypothetical protein [Pseudomonadota bacterium]